MSRRWTADDLRILRTSFGTMDDVMIARALKRSEAQVRRKARELALAKDKRAFPGELAMPRWTDAEIAKLRKLYPKTSNVEIARQLDRSLKSITSKACSLKLEKDRERLAEMGRENIRLRRDRGAS
jgi:hypothetical protein